MSDGEAECGSMTSRCIAALKTPKGPARDRAAVHVSKKRKLGWLSEEGREACGMRQPKAVQHPRMQALIWRTPMGL